MPFLIWPALTGFLLLMASSLVVKVLLSLGIFFVTKTGMDSAGSLIMSQLNNALSGFSSDAVQFVYMSGCFEAVSIMVSAVVVKITINATGKVAFKKSAAGL